MMCEKKQDFKKQQKKLYNSSCKIANQFYFAAFYLCVINYAKHSDTSFISWEIAAKMVSFFTCLPSNPTKLSLLRIVRLINPFYFKDWLGILKPYIL